MPEMTSQQAFDLALQLQRAGQLAEAQNVYESIVAVQPNHVDSWNNLGNVLRRLGRIDQAIAAFRLAIQHNPNYAEAHNNLGVALWDTGQSNAAVAEYQRALALKPDYVEAINNLANVLTAMERLDEALAAFGRGLAIRPDLAVLHSNLGNVLRDMGRIDDAIACFRQATELAGDGGAALASNLIYAMHLHPNYDARAILHEARRWNLRYARPIQPLPPLPPDRQTDRPLRIGYVSPDFCDHPVGRTFLPLLRGHDRDEFEIFLYSSAPRSDATTAALRGSAENWREISAVDDDAAARMIRADQIDILVDLAAHTANNRLPVFARKPAPIQATYLGYPGTTGLEAMNYRITDPFLDDPAGDLGGYSEKLIWLGHGYLCFQAPADAPPVEPPPMLSGGGITFGSLNHFGKTSSAALGLWGELLKRLPRSRLLIRAPDGSCRQRVRDAIGAAGVDADRVMFLPRQSRTEYWRLFSRIDVALDSLPYSGHVTTCDSLWMGVPVVSLAGRTAVGRGSKSVLGNIGMGELVANSPEQYLKIAADLAGDPARLSRLRSDLRRRMQSSPLMNAPLLARDLETVYRQMWRE